MRGAWVLGWSLLLFAGAAQAGDICDYYRSNAPDLFKLLCGGSSHRASLAGAYSTFNDGFNINAGVLPTQPTSYGLEAIGSMLRVSPHAISPTFSLIKGFRRIGTGISTAGNSTFYGNDILQRTKRTPELTTFQPIEPPIGYVTNLNVGTAVKLWAPKRTSTVNLGVSLRYNKTTNTLGGGPGLLVASPYLTMGVGITREKVSNFLNAMYFYTGMISTRILFLELEYTLLSATGGLGLEPIHIVTASMSINRLMLTAAARRLNYSLYGVVTQEYYAAQVLVSKSMSLGAVYNFIPGATSLAMQYYL